MGRLAHKRAGVVQMRRRSQICIVRGLPARGNEMLIQHTGSFLSLIHCQHSYLTQATGPLNSGSTRFVSGKKVSVTLMQLAYLGWQQHCRVAVAVMARSSHTATIFFLP